jgi:hypothetical protein
MGYGDNVPPALRVDTFPATLYAPNHVHVFWISFVKWDIYQVRWAVDGGPEIQIRLDISGLEGDWDLRPTTPGARYSIKVQGCNKGLFGVTYCSPWSDPTEVIALQNLSSTRAFLAASGVNLSQAVSIRALSPAILRIGLRALLAGGQ